MLSRTVADFLAEAAGAVVLEDGAVAFDLAQAKYSISGERNKCLLHLWSAERNAVRRVDAVVEVDCTDRGNVATRLVHATNETAALERFAESIARARGILPNCEVAVLSSAEISLRWRGLEFARARMGAEEITFAAGRRSCLAWARKSVCWRIATGRCLCSC